MTYRTIRQRLLLSAGSTVVMGLFLAAAASSQASATDPNLTYTTVNDATTDGGQRSATHFQPTALHHHFWESRSDVAARATLYWYTGMQTRLATWRLEGPEGVYHLLDPTDDRERFPEIMLIQGGVHATVFAERILTSGETDVIVHNEGEITTVKLVEALANGKDLSTVKGISGPIKTNADGVQVSKLLPNIAKHGNKLAILRTMAQKTGNG